MAFNKAIQRAVGALNSGVIKYSGSLSMQIPLNNEPAAAVRLVESACPTGDTAGRKQYGYLQ